MELGPIEILVIGFPENNFTGEIAPALADLVETGLIRVIDLVFIAKDADGNVLGVELSELDDSVKVLFQPHVLEPAGMIADEDVEDIGAGLKPDSSAAILLVEHVWATRFQQAVADAGGQLISSLRIPKEVIDMVLADS